jgi:hypothetical protein
VGVAVRIGTDGDPQHRHYGAEASLAPRGNNGDKAGDPSFAIVRVSFGWARPLKFASAATPSETPAARRYVSFRTG